MAHKALPIAFLEGSRQLEPLDFGLYHLRPLPWREVLNSHIKRPKSAS